MVSLLDGILDAANGVKKDTKFPDAPDGWSTETALQVARQEGLKLGEEHWEAVRALQEYFAKHAERPINLRELHDALGEKFHAKGGIKHVYELFPGGPVAQGCRVAGLKAPAGAADKSFGSVV